MNVTTLHRLVATAVGAGAIAVGALAMSAPASAASIQQTCEQQPGLYADGAVLGVYSTQKRGFDRDQICKVYDASHKLLGTYTATDYGYYRLVTKVTPAPVLSQR
jgi:hypothetical protein